MRQMPFTIALAIAAFVGSHAHDAEAQSTPPHKGEWSLTPYAGTSFDISGDIVSGASANGTRTFGGDTVSGSITVKNQQFRDLFEHAVTAGARISYGLTNKIEVFGDLGYTHASGSRFNAGSASVTINGAPLASGPVDGEMSDYQEIGFALGFREYFREESVVRPYWGLSAGFLHTDSLEIDLTFAGGEQSDVKFSDTTISPVGSLLFGFRWGLSERTSVGLDGAVRYRTELDSDDTDLGNAGPLNEVNEGDARIYGSALLSLTMEF